MYESKKYNVFLTFDCDPANFDLSLRSRTDPGFSHLEESIPRTLSLLDEAGKIAETEVKATFFIRNISTDANGLVFSEPWTKFMNLWSEVISKGHGLGLHPHIDKPLTGEDDSNFSLLERVFFEDFQILRKVGENSRVTRIGGHAYNSVTSALLRKVRVAIDSSAIPGRKLGQYPNCSNWLNVNNDFKTNWTYPNGNSQKIRVKTRLAQFPMTTLQSKSQPDYYRYLDFSFSSFDDFSVTNEHSLRKSQNLVAISHPSTLLENKYEAHPTLTFGTKNWLFTFSKFIHRLLDNNNQINYPLLREFV